LTGQPALATVATSGKFTDLTSIPKLSTAANTGSFTDLTNQPTIPAAQVQCNWTETNTSATDYIQNKPSLAAVATAGTYASLMGAPLATVYNNSVAQTAVKVWCGSAKTTGGQANFFQTGTNATGGTALFRARSV